MGYYYFGVLNFGLVFRGVVDRVGLKPIFFLLSPRPRALYLPLPDPFLPETFPTPFAAVRPPQTSAPVPFEPPSSSLHSWVGGRTLNAAVKEESTPKASTVERVFSPELLPPAAIAGEP